jgi:hypothetical protein
MELQYKALEMGLTKLPKFELLLKAKSALVKFPKRLVKSMTYSGPPSIRWRNFHSFCYHTAKVTALNTDSCSVHCIMYSVHCSTTAALYNSTNIAIYSLPR